MMTNIRKITAMMISAMVAAIIMVGCNDDDAITYSVEDVSSRITGFSKDITGPGAPLTINGSEMDKVSRIFIGNVVVMANSFTDVSPSSISFTVPLTVSLGESDVLVVYKGNGRAFKKITVVALPAISSFTPPIVVAGEPVTVIGANLAESFVSGVKIGGIDAEVISQSANALTFTVPAGFATGKITLVSPAAEVNSAENLLNCADDPGSIDCMTALNTNPGFESGAGDNFDGWSKLNGGTLMVATTVPGEYHSGTRALKVVRDGTLGNGQWRIQLANDPSTWEVGASYSVYVRAKATANGGSMRVSTSPSSTAMYSGDQNVTTSWQWLRFTFPSANVASAGVVLDMNGNQTVATTFFIDEVKLVKD
jgi:hypothetical protein